MTPNKQSLIWTSILVSILTFTLLLVAYNYKQQLEVETNKNNNSQLKIIKNYIHNTERVKIPIDSEWTLCDSKMSHHALDEILGEASSLCLLIDKSQCEVCWKKALVFLKDNTKKLSLHPVILFSGYLPKDFARICTDIPFPCYLIVSTTKLDNFFQTSEPMYFVLSPTKDIHFVFYPDGMYDTMGNHYLSTIASYIKNNKSYSSTNMVTAENPQIEIKKSPLRKKLTVKLYLQNRGNKTVNIQRVLPSCDCMLIENYPNTISARDKTSIDVSIVPDKKGWMQRSVTIILDNKQTIEFNIDIYVV